MPSTPRNRGLEISCGEYIFFMDNDDSIIPTALEELYTLAKSFEVDVVHCEKYYEAGDTANKLLPTSYRKRVFVDKPAFEPESLPERINKVLNELYRLHLF